MIIYHYRSVLRATAHRLLLASAIGDFATAAMLNRVLATLCVLSQYQNPVSMLHRDFGRGLKSRRSVGR